MDFPVVGAFDKYESSGDFLLHRGKYLYDSPIT